MRYEIFDVDGNVENVIVADEGFILMNYPDRHRLVEDAKQFPEESTVIKEAFINRFTAEEWAAFENYENSQKYKIRMKLARIVDLKCAWVSEMLDELVANSILDESRKETIVNAPIDSTIEKPALYYVPRQQ